VLKNILEKVKNLKI